MSVITAEEYDRCYFLVHRAYAHFFDDIDNIYEKPKYKLPQIPLSTSGV